MKDETRRVYRIFAIGFIVIGGVFALLAVAEAFFAVGLLRGNALPVALFIGLIGVALLVTVRQRPD